MAHLLFDIKDLIYHYNNITALNRLSMQINQGKRYAILGANGSGKSTLLRVLDGLYFPESGSIRFEGQSMTEQQFQDEKFTFSFRRKVGMVFQNPDVQLFNPTVFDEIAFGPLQLKWQKEKIRDRITAILNLMDLEHLKERAPHRLSGGEKKRVALASVLVLDPDVLILDEPTTSLDPKSQSQIINFLVDWAGGSKTIITATHDLDIVEDIADHCFIFQNGAVVAEGEPAAVLYDEELLNRTNLIHAHRHAHSSGKTHIHHHLHRGQDHPGHKSQEHEDFH